MKFAVNVEFKGLNDDKTAELVKKAGFDGIFFNWAKKGDTERAAELCEKHGLIHQSVHAPFGRINEMWTPDYGEILERQLICLEEAASCGVKLVISHVFIGFHDHSPNEYGIESFSKYIDAAKRLGVKLAFENTEGEEYLEALFKNLGHRKNMGFCWDSGHEQCYNRGRNMLGEFGNKLIATHINDNLGVTGEEITFFDDSHLLPYDGVTNWDNAAKNLAASKPLDILTLEVMTENRPERNTHYIYDALSPEEYLEKALCGAKRLWKNVEKYRSV